MKGGSDHGGSPASQIATAPIASSGSASSAMIAPPAPSARSVRSASASLAIAIAIPAPVSVCASNAGVATGGGEDDDAHFPQRFVGTFRDFFWSSSKCSLFPRYCGTPVSTALELFEYVTDFHAVGSELHFAQCSLVVPMTFLHDAHGLAYSPGPLQRSGGE